MKPSFNIYNASAGSGKTFTLVKQYLLILLKTEKADAYKNILAITFTNKAVGEMKKRLVENLHQLSDPETSATGNSMMELLVQESGLTEDVIRERSGRILQHIIHNYAAFEISTIDGFTHRVIRTFSRDIGIPMNFEVELDTEEILREAVDRLISKAGKDKKLTKVLVNFTLTKTDDDKSWDIARDLFEISKLLINENNQEFLPLIRDKQFEDFKIYDSKIREDLKTLKSNYKELANDFFFVIQENGIDANWFTRGSVPKYFSKILEEEEPNNFDTQWAQNIAQAPLYNKSLDASSKDLMDSFQPQIAEIFEQTRAIYFQMEMLKEILKNLVQLSLLNEINKQVEIIKEERNVLLISEFNSKISEQVKDQPAPFIYERLGQRFQHYFIDEFQDTSMMQWNNMTPLISHNLSQDELPASLTLVGDAKQSIYRWRGGRAELLIDLSNSENPFQIQENVQNLPANYRSTADIVNFNNRFFKFAAGKLTEPLYSSLFEKADQQVKIDEKGFVSLDFLESDNAEDKNDVYAEKVFEIVNQLKQKGEPLGNICILTRKKKEGAMLAEFLSLQGIAIVSSETLLLSRSPKVNFLVDVLQLNLNPENDDLKFAVFSYLIEELGLEAEEFNRFSALKPKSGFEFFSWLTEFDMKFDPARIDELSLYESLEYIIRSFEIVEKSDAYVQFFLDFAFEFTQKKSGNVMEFLETWESKKDKLSIVAPESSDAVRIMTIHTAKGLEFPVVIHPFANSEFQNTRFDNLWITTGDEHIPVVYVNASSKMKNWNEHIAGNFEKLISQNELDALNVFYVACTRAVNQLYILTDKKEKPSSSLTLPDMLAEFLQLEGKWDGSDHYEYGEMTISERIAPKNEVFHPEHFYSSETENDAVHILTRSGALWDSKQKEAIEKGEVVHEILARIHTEADLEKSVHWAIRNGLITEAEKEEISAYIHQIIVHPDAKEYFSEEVAVMNEKDILLTNGNRIRPDRLCISGKNMSIIDYKTGGFVDKHSRQVENYAEHLEAMGYIIKEKLLIYTTNPISVRKI